MPSRNFVPTLSSEYGGDAEEKENVSNVGTTSNITFNVNSEETALDEIQTEEFSETLRDYYLYRDGETEMTLRGYKKFSEMEHADLIEYFYQDRSWANNNTGSMGKDVFNALTGDENRKKQLAYIQNTYSNLPSFWNDPNRNFGEWLIDNGGAMIADPVNLVSFGLGGQAAKVSLRQGLKEALKGKAAGELTKQHIREMAKDVTKKQLGKAVKAGAIREAKLSAGVSVIQDALLQTTALQTGVQEEFSFGRMGVATAAGVGFGSVFGGAFSYGGFKLGARQFQNTAIRQLKDLHEYGRSDITGQRLFADLVIQKPKDKLYKNLNQKQINEIEYKSKLTGNTLDEKIVNLRKTQGTGTSSGELLNLVKFPKKIRGYLANLADEKVRKGEYFNDEVTQEYAQQQARILGLDPDAVLALGNSRAKNDKLLYAEILAHGDLLAKESDDILKLANNLHAANLTPEDELKIVTELNLRNELAGQLLINQKEITKNIARAMRFMQVNKDVTRAAELKIRPEDPDMMLLKEGNPTEFWKAISKLDDTDQVIVALQNARKAEPWLLSAEYINNNLLSSPDTHGVNFISSLVQTQWKPATMLMKAAFMSRSNKKRANELMKEAADTYIYQFHYTKEALKAAKRSFIEGRGLFDATAMKYDNSMRQGQLQKFIEASGKLLTEPLGTVGVGLQKAVINPVAKAITLPMRVLSATDEFFKVMTYKARQAAHINTKIREEANAGYWDTMLNKNKFKKRFDEINKEWANDPDNAASASSLQYAREITFTQSALSQNPETGKMEGGITSNILAITKKHPSLRALGLHFINTPSNLIKWNFEQLPLARRAIVSTRHALKKGADGKYINPENAAEANARTAMGMVLWTSAFFAVSAGKITGGGSKNYRENVERENTTGWQPYSYKTDDGRYVSLNRLDPIMMPFFIMADLFDTLDKYTSLNEDLPSEVENSMTELTMGVLTSLTRNLTSKFYTKNIIETASFFLGDSFTKTSSPERLGSSILARGIGKVTPLSGALRYASRVDEESQKELFTLSDRLLQLNPLANQDGIMPKRNMFGETVNKKRGWLFGISSKGSEGIWSSPFAMTETKSEVVKQFYEERDFKYTPPDKVDRKSKIDLRTIRKKDGQTAYDRLRELTGVVKLSYKNGQHTLKYIVEDLIEDTNSVLYSLPKGTTGGKDYQQSVILKYVHFAEKMAKFEMMKEFPIIKETMISRGEFIQERLDDANKSYLQRIFQ